MKEGEIFECCMRDLPKEKNVKKPIILKFPRLRRISESAIIKLERGDKFRTEGAESGAAAGAQCGVILLQKDKNKRPHA